MGGGPPGFPQGFPCPAVLWIQPCEDRFRLRGFHLLWPAFPKPFGYPPSINSAVRNPRMRAFWFGLFPVRSPLLRKSMFLSFPPPTKMFQFRGLASLRMLDLQSNRLSHSDILGSNLVCKSPRLFAAYHVLRRLQEPRHPPYALFYFLTPICRLLSTYSFISYPQSCQRTLSLPTVKWRIRESNP